MKTLFILVLSVCMFFRDSVVFAQEKSKVYKVWIDQFDKGYKINFPPLIAIIPQQEEVTYDNEKMFAKKDNLFIPFEISP